MRPARVCCCCASGWKCWSGTPPAALAPRLADARGIAEGAVGELRRIVAALSPAVLERLGLAAALRNLLARFAPCTEPQVRARITAPSGLARPQEEAIYRVAQEALQNVAKHSGATRVMFFARFDDRRVRLRVADNGAGFEQKKAGNKPTSFGLAGMRERAALIAARSQSARLRQRRADRARIATSWRKGGR